MNYNIVYIYIYNSVLVNVLLVVNILYDELSELSDDVVVVVFVFVVAAAASTASTAPSAFDGGGGRVVNY